MKPPAAVRCRTPPLTREGKDPYTCKDMSKVTSKRQVTIPKAVADRYGIGSGDEIEFEPAGEVIRLIPPSGKRPTLGREERLRLFDRATERQRERESRRGNGVREGAEDRPAAGRGWTREELYDRGLGWADGSD